MTRRNGNDPLVCNGSALRKAARRVSQLYDEMLAPCGVGVAQRSILVHIDRGEDPSMTELARAMVLDRSALAHNLKPLVRDGFVALRPDPHDGRSRRAVLTAKGRAKLLESNRLWQDAQRRFEKNYGSERARALRVTLAEIVTDDFAKAFRSTT